MGMFALPKTLLLILFLRLGYYDASSSVHMPLCVFSFACVGIRSFIQANLYSKDQAKGLEISGKGGITLQHQQSAKDGCSPSGGQGHVPGAWYLVQPAVPGVALRRIGSVLLRHALPPPSHMPRSPDHAHLSLLGRCVALMVCSPLTCSLTLRVLRLFLP